MGSNRLLCCCKGMKRSREMERGRYTLVQNEMVSFINYVYTFLSLMSLHLYLNSCIFSTKFIFQVFHKFQENYHILHINWVVKLAKSDSSDAESHRSNSNFITCFDILRIRFDAKKLQLGTTDIINFLIFNISYLIKMCKIDILMMFT